MMNELVTAIKGGLTTKVVSLLQDGCNPNTEGDLQPIIVAAESGQDAIVELLLDSGAHIDVISQVNQYLYGSVGSLSTIIRMGRQH